MAQQQAPDDIFALFCRYDLDVSQYHVFERDVVDGVEPGTSATARSMAEPLKTGAFSPVTELRKESAVLAEVAKAPVSTDAVRSRAGLRNLLTNIQQIHDLSATTNPNTFCQPVTLIGSCGGVGVTTIMANLARQLSKQGLRCGLYDEAVDSALPLFMGYRRLATTNGRMAGLASVLEPTISLLGQDSIPMEAALMVGELSVREKVMHTYQSELDFFMAYEGRNLQQLPHGITLMVALPDVPSIASVRNMVARTRWSCRSEETLCIVNRFDGSVPLHRELLAWFEEQFSHVMTIRHSYLIPEALAEGTSVMEMAPDSDAAEDFAQLAARVRQISMRLAAAARKNDGRKIQTEGLALCS